MTDRISVDVHAVETALRRWLAIFDYDLHKQTVCSEDEGTDTYPDEAALFFAHLKSAVQQPSA
ncbi:hypothetical protein [Streptomyces sp. NPDC048659]|uniref:hypothetical protein n=1 Tax=Streptomyces sp. NPDC048659 TaxID=3155489 RepID=UPI0034482517